MGFLLCLLFAGLALLDIVSAHYSWTALIVNGTVTEDYYYVRHVGLLGQYRRGCILMEGRNNTNPSDEAVFPVKDLTSTALRCNVGGTTTGQTTHTATVIAGSTVGFRVNPPIFHHGPIAVYMSAVFGSINSYDGSGPWFKINELGPVFNPGNVMWPADDLKQYSFQIPAKTPPGPYLLRIEQIGLHLGLNLGAAEFYVSCAQIVVIGNGGGTPGPTCVLPGAYSPEDPGILLNIYDPVPTAYTPPGPTPWSGN